MAFTRGGVGTRPVRLAAPMKSARRRAVSLGSGGGRESDGPRLREPAQLGLMLQDHPRRAPKEPWFRVIPGSDPVAAQVWHAYWNDM
jgi:hypothetical protein